jgi:hypothetical protein
MEKSILTYLLIFDRLRNKIQYLDMDVFCLMDAPKLALDKRVVFLSPVSFRYSPDWSSVFHRSPSFNLD